LLEVPVVVVGTVAVEVLGDILLIPDIPYLQAPQLQ
jgi:hypothetical protein